MQRHRKMGGTTSESLGKPPFGSRPLIAGGRQEALTMRCIARGSLSTRRKADAISMGLYHCSLVLTGLLGFRLIPEPLHLFERRAIGRAVFGGEQRLDAPEPAFELGVDAA